MFAVPVARPGRILLWLAIVLVSACSEQSPVASEKLAAALDDSALEHAQKHADSSYVCPMHPQIVRAEPGSCPICGMDLVEKLVQESGDSRPVVTVDSRVVQSMGVRTGPARRDTLWKFIRTVGRVDYDETRLTHVHPRSEGWLEKLKLRAEGDPVRKGQVLGQLYAPEILAAQVDFIIAIDQKHDRHLEKARNRLRLFGVGESTINRIQARKQAQNTVPIVSPSAGVVSELNVREGMYVKPESEIFSIADLSRMWVLVDVFEHQIDWLREGLDTEIRVPAHPGRSWEGKVDYIYPELDPVSRTLQVRLAFDNPDGLLKANMFAEVLIYGGPRHDVLVIPAEALIETGSRSSVIKALGDGRFQPVDVVTGMQSNGRVEILQGLREQDEVVLSGQFLIDSESSLQASFMRMRSASEPSAGAVAEGPANE